MGDVTMERIVPKGWGHERIWADGHGYTGKVLHFRAIGSKFSMHFHAVKHETWLVTKGGFTFRWIDTEEAETHERVLRMGDRVVIPRHMPHQLIALSPGAEVMEVSTPHDAADSYRIEPGHVLP